MSLANSILIFALFFLGGIFFGSFIYFPSFLLFALLVLGGGFVFFPKSIFPKKVFIFLIFLEMVGGIFWIQKTETRIEKLELRSLVNKEVTLTGMVGQVREAEGPSTTFIMKEIEHDQGKKKKKIEGKVLLVADNYPKHEYGDRLSFKGTLEYPSVFPDFNYRGFLAKEGIYVLMYFPQIEFLDSEKGNKLIAWNLALKDKLSLKIGNSFSPPQSAILEAMILGNRDQLSSRFQEKLSRVGISHILAISGMHLIILSQILVVMSRVFRLKRTHIFYFVSGVLLLFIFLVGGRPSIIRAGLMSFLLLFGQKIGRPLISARGLIFVAVLLLLFNPLLLRLDIGFQLSFLATLGIIWLRPILKLRWPHFFNNPLGEIIGLTFSAQLFTLPLTIYYFHQASLVGLLVNLLVIPFLPLLLMMGFCFLSFALIWERLGQLISWLLGPLLNYLVGLVNYFSGLPWATARINISGWEVLLLYLFLGIGVYFLGEKQNFFQKRHDVINFI
jgi:competence protein ComEC